ncbi:MAG: hypothetical protein Q7S50_01675 [bacterium]|nr:hypothetical protein [bacterium]
MKNKLLYISILPVLLTGGYFIYSHFSPIGAKCPDDYANDDAGSAEYLAATDKWTNDFYDGHPGATLADWSAARYQFWIDNSCTAALQRYDEAKAGKADPAAMERIRSGIQDAIGTTTP